MERLSRAEIEAKLNEWLETEFTFHAVGPVARTLCRLERQEQDFVLDWVRRIATTHITLAFHFARRAPELLCRLDQRAIEALAVELCDTYDRAGMYAALAVAEQADRYARMRQDRRDGALFDEVAGVLGNFLHGLSGRRLKIEKAETIWSDGEVIRLPAIMAILPTVEGNFRLLKAAVALQWAQTRYGTHRFDPRPHCANYADPARALRQLHGLETIRLLARIRQELPGLYRDMQSLLALQNEGLPADWETFAVLLQQAQSTFEDSLALLPAAYAASDFVPWSFQGEWRPDAVMAARAARIDKEKARLRLRLAELEKELRARRDEAPNTDAARARSRFSAQVTESAGHLEFEITLDGMPIAPPEEVRQLLASVYLDFGQIPPEHLAPAGEGEYDPHLYGAASADPDAVWQGTYHEEGALLYPEWDHGRQHYRKNWAVMREKDVPPVDDDFYSQTLSKHAGLLRHLRKSFEALRGENRLEKRQADGEEVDIDALVEAIADARNGREMSDRLFTRLDRNERSIAVAFMVDMSGSTRGWINEAEREALILLCEALERLGDRYAIYGFSGITRKRCELFRVKTFAEPYSQEVKARISGIRPQEYTRMGFAIRHLSRLLAETEAKTRVLITLSDGRPDDYFDGYRGPYGIEDTRMALIEARRAGIYPFCITLDREAREYLPHMYGAARYILLDDVRDLPAKVAEVYRRLTR